MKYLLWAVIIYFAWRWYTASKQSSSQSDSSTESTRSAESGDDGAAEAMVKCAQCGIHLPYSEAVHGSGAITFCSAEHRRLHGNA